MKSSIQKVQRIFNKNTYRMREHRLSTGNVYRGNITRKLIARDERVKVRAT